jgi:hypothetical protein
MAFWKIITGVGIVFLLSLLFFINSDFSITGVDDAKISGLDQKTLYLGEGEPCGVSSVECRPGLICESVIESTISGGICVKPDFDGPFDINPEIPEYDESKENNWNEYDLD